MPVDDIQQLIAQLGSGDGQEHRAAARLVLLGADATAPMLEALRAASPDRILPIARTVSRIRTAEALPRLAAFARDPDYKVAPAAIDAIGFSRSESAAEVLGGLLAAPTPHRDRVARALGELGDPRGREILAAEAARLIVEPQDASALDAATAQARDDGDPSNLRSYIAIAVALAKLGDHALARSVGTLSSYDRAAQEDPESYIVRLEATHALRVLVGPGLFAHLVDALGDPSQEVQESALRSMLLLGAKQSVAAWLDVERDIAALAPLAHALIHELVGEWPGGAELAEDTDDAARRAWWTARESKFLAGTCYRLGRRAWPPDLFPQLDAGSPSVIDDLRVITGVDFALHVDPQLVLDGAPDAVSRTARAWWDAHGQRFDHGGLCKYGHRQDLARVFEA
jgi:HEAT repeat protein